MRLSTERGNLKCVRLLYAIPLCRGLRTALGRFSFLSRGGTRFLPVVHLLMDALKVVFGLASQADVWIRPWGFGADCYTQVTWGLCFQDRC